MSRRVSHQTLRRLTYFAMIAETGSVRGAAERLGLSVPVVSEALSELEEELSVTLANRTTRRFDLTDAGKIVHEAAASMLRVAEDAFQFQSDERPLSGRLSLTLPVELATGWLSKRIKAFRAEHPNVELSVEATDNVRDLGKSAIDLAIRTSYRPPGSDRDDREYLELACVATRPFRSNKAEANSLYIDRPLIARHSNDWIDAWDPKSKSMVHVRSHETIVVNNRQTAITIAREGLGLALVLKQSVDTELAEGSLAMVKRSLDFGGVSVDYVYRDNLPSREARAFVKTSLQLV